MRIVQLSDIHIGSYFNQDVFDIVVDEVNNQLKPDAIIITGDLTDEGLLFQFERAHTQISRFNCSNIIVLPGNHDYRHTGYLLFKKFFPSSTQIYEFNDSVAVLTVGTARPDRDEGEVGYRQSLWVENTLSRYANKLKVIAMHHHLIGIPDTGTDKIVILDAGDTLRAFLQSGVNLVLCGHKHRPWVWKLGGLEIAYAGTVSSTRFRGFFECSYNIVDVKDGRPHIDIKIVGGKRMSLSDLVERYRPQLELD
jgi:3',5'-cyclic AMP phosphodiesterase CpdA